MSVKILKISEDFWNIRGEFKVGGLINIGTHCSLVKLKNERFVLLDAYTLPDDIKVQVDAITDQGNKIDAIINLHPFHTLHVNAAHTQFPNAKLYGTARHLSKFPQLEWQPERTESIEFANLFADDFSFSVPAGVDFISKNEHLHFASVLAYHMASKTIHADDTLMYFPLPWPAGLLRKPTISFHPTLSKTLRREAGAADEFKAWATQLTVQWHDAENLCAAHCASLIMKGEEGENKEKAYPGIADGIRKALNKVERTLATHRHRYD